MPQRPGPRVPRSAWLWLLSLWALTALGFWLGAIGEVSGRVGESLFMQWDWQPGLWRSQPWRLWTAAFVHWSSTHLFLNLLACLALGAWGHTLGLGRLSTLAWFAAWPLTHLLLSFSSSADHYGGLSGVLHAGVAIGVWKLLSQGPGTSWWIGAAVGLGLVVKLVVEVPMLSESLGLIFNKSTLTGAPAVRVAGEAHLAGVIAGLGCACVFFTASEDHGSRRSVFL